MEEKNENGLFLDSSIKAQDSLQCGRPLETSQAVLYFRTFSNTAHVSSIRYNIDYVFLFSNNFQNISMRRTASSLKT